MDIEFLNKIRVNFYLSNYKKVIELWKEIFNHDLSLTYVIKNEFTTIIQRTILKIFKNEENLYNDNIEYFKICENSIELYLNYLAPLITDISLENLNNKFLEMEEILDINKDNLDFQIIYNHICLNLKYYDKMIKVSQDYKFSNLEYKIMIIRGLINNNQIKEAKEKIDVIKSNDDEDILVDLIEIEYLIKIEDYKNCLEILEELRSKYGDYPKILNLIGNCFIGLNNYDKASELLIKLYNILNEKIKDNTEIEICIKNLITLNILKGKEQIPTKNLLQNLKEITNDEDPLILKIATINQKI